MKKQLLIFALGMSILIGFSLYAHFTDYPTDPDYPCIDCLSKDISP